MCTSAPHARSHWFTTVKHDHAHNCGARLSSCVLDGEASSGHHHRVCNVKVCFVWSTSPPQVDTRRYADIRIIRVMARSTSVWKPTSRSINVTRWDRGVLVAVYRSGSQYNWGLLWQAQFSSYVWRPEFVVSRVRNVIDLNLHLTFILHTLITHRYHFSP